MARVKIAGTGEIIRPSRLQGNDAIFEGLACGRGLDVTIELEQGHWLVIPVPAADLSQTNEHASLVRHSVIAR